MSFREVAGPFGTWGAIVCVVFGIWWVLRLKKEGRRALVMAGAFALMGVAVYGYGQEWPLAGVGSLAGIVLALLVWDAMWRAADQAKRQQK